jgi:hypothetical protein
MDPELEALLRAWEAYDAQEQGSEAERLLARYESSLASAAATRKLNPDVLHRAVKWAFRDWIRAQSHPPTLPPKA